MQDIKIQINLGKNDSNEKFIEISCIEDQQGPNTGDIAVTKW